MGYGRTTAFWCSPITAKAEAISKLMASHKLCMEPTRQTSAWVLPGICLIRGTGHCSWQGTTAELLRSGRNQIPSDDDCSQVGQSLAAKRRTGSSHFLAICYNQKSSLRLIGGFDHVSPCPLSPLPDR